MKSIYCYIFYRFSFSEVVDPVDEDLQVYFFTSNAAPEFR